MKRHSLTYRLARLVRFLDWHYPPTLAALVLALVLVVTLIGA